jgi:ketosteroid isomerase-like protein
VVKNKEAAMPTDANESAATVAGPLTQEERSVREKNIEALRRFFGNDYGRARETLWHDDAVFELPFEPGGRLVIKGREANVARNKWSSDAWKEFAFKDIRIYPTLDPELFFLSFVAEGVTTAKDGGRRVEAEHMNLFRVKDGKVIHRVEYQNPLAYEGWRKWAPGNGHGPSEKEVRPGRTGRTAR